MKEKDNLQNGWGKKSVCKWRYKEFISKTCEQSMQLNLKKKGKVGQRSKWAIEGIQVDIKYTKRCSASLIIREM